MCQKQTQSWPECSTLLSFKKILYICITDSDAQTDNITCDHKEENNHQVINELKVLSQHLFNYNKRTFEKFMQDVKEEYREWINVNKKIQCEIEDLKMQV